MFVNGEISDSPSPPSCQDMVTRRRQGARNGQCRELSGTSTPQYSRRSDSSMLLDITTLSTSANYSRFHGAIVCQWRNALFMPQR